MSKDPAAPSPATDALPTSEADWRQRLSPEAYRILREKGTEPPYSGHLDYDSESTFVCAGCGSELFEAATKYESGCGWPSFTAPATNNAVVETPDHSHGMVRTEITCSKCGGHLGHVFDDGPGPTGLRYCINAVALEVKTVKT